MNRILKSKSDLYVKGIKIERIVYATSRDFLAIRLLASVTNLDNKLPLQTEDRLYTFDGLSHSHFYFYDQPENLYYIDSKHYYIVAEILFDLSKMPSSFFRPLSNYLILLKDDRFIFENFQLKTSVSHYRVPQYLQELGKTSKVYCLAQIYTTNGDADLSNASWSLTEFADAKLMSNMNLELGFTREDADKAMSDSYSKSAKTGRNRLQATLELKPLQETVESELGALFEVRCVKNGKVQKDANFTVHIEAVDGYAPHQRIQLQNGSNRFHVYATHLAAGDTLRVKAGLPFYKGIAEAEIKVIAAQSTAVDQITSDEVKAMIQTAIADLKSNMQSFDDQQILALEAMLVSRMTTLIEQVSLENANRLMQKFESQIAKLQDQIARLQ